ncbi:hypothetical protein GA0115237_114650 [Streptomyces sp. ScaeMP-6W]|nr:hypothetical protein GA0115237_114650 [Streptomyces sp. ScaeMP-6W]
MRRPGWDAAWLGSAPACPPCPCGSPMASIAGRAGVWCGWAPPLRARPCPCVSLMASNAGQAVGCRAPSRPCRSKTGLNRRPGWDSVGLGSAPAWPSCPCGSPMASNAGRAVGCRAPSRPCRSKTGLNRRPGYWGSRCVRRLGRAGPHQGTSSQTARCGVSRFKAAEHGSLLRGHPGTTPPYRLVGVVPPVGGKRQAVTHRSLWRARATTVVTVERPYIGDGLIRPPAVGRVRDRGVGSCRGAPAANCTHGRLEATDPAPCSL